MDDIKVNPDDEIPEINKFSREIHELPNKESFKCPKHPNHKIDTLVVNEDKNDMHILCVKCLVEDGRYLFGESGYQVCIIKDLLQNYVESLDQSEDRDEILEAGELQRKFVAFVANNYPSQYNAHLEGQYQLADQEIGIVIEELQKLKELYREFILNKIAQMDTKREDIKKEADKLCKEEREPEKPQYNSIGEVYVHLDAFESKDQVLRFLKDICLKTKEKTREGDVTRGGKMLRLFEEFEKMFEALKGIEVNAFYIREIGNQVKRLQKSEDNLFKKPLSLRPENRCNLKLEMPQISQSSFGDNDYTRSTFNALENPNYSPLISHEDPFDHKPAKKNSRRLGKKRRETFFIQAASQSLKNIKKNFLECKNIEGGYTVSIKTRFRHYLTSWANRRITGYLVFRNTMNSVPNAMREESDYTDLGIHINNMMGMKWKGLMDQERKIYIKVAKTHRNKIRKEIEEFEDFDEFGGFVDMLDRRSKQIKREM